MAMGRSVSLIYAYWLRGGIIREPYEAFAPDPLTGWRYEPSAAVSALLGEAAESLRELASRPSWADPEPAADWVLRRLEGVASSAVEGINTTLRSLAAHESARMPSDSRNAEADAAAVGAWRQNRLALEMGALPATTTADLCGLHARLLRQTSQNRIAGRVRTEQNWVGRPSDRTPRTAVFVPPPPEMVPEMLDDLAGWMSSPQEDPLAAAAVAHAQFVTIHPFDDGNGRTGRALSHLMLRRGGAVGGTPVPLTAALEPVRASYFEAMNACRHEGPPGAAERSEAMDEWVALFAESAVIACTAAGHALASVDETLARWNGYKLRDRSAAKRALGVLETMPVIEAPELAERLGVSETAARRGLARLEDIGAVVAVDTPHNGRRFEAPEILDLVDRRKEVIDEMWAFRHAGLTWEPAQHSPRPTRSDTGISPPAAPDGCEHVGPIARNRCRLPAGHRGHHRYN